MRRIFAETRIYDYTTKKEAYAHIEQMRAKGWDVAYRSEEHREEAQPVYSNGQDEYPYSVEFARCK